MKKPIDVQLTKEGFEKVKQEKIDLIARRPGVVTRMSAAREQGDLSENAGYHAAKEELGKIDSRVRELDMIIKFADVIESAGPDSVSLGNKVTVEVDGDRMVYALVGELEADPSQGKISKASPIGSALMGKKVGDVVKIETPGGSTSVKVVNVEIS